MARCKEPVSVAGIEFDALIEETKTLSATVPVYPIEDGFNVSDTIILDPVQISMTLYVSNTPVTWLYRHGSSTSRVRNICEQIEDLWLSKKLVKIKTCESKYKSMAITSLSIKKSKEIGYAREISLTAQEVRVTEKKTTVIPAYVLKSGATGANAGAASTSSESASASGSGSGGSGGSSGSGGDSSSSRGRSALYGAASGLGFI